MYCFDSFDDYYEAYLVHTEFVSETGDYAQTFISLDNEEFTVITDREGEVWDSKLYYGRLAWYLD